MQFDNEGISFNSDAANMTYNGSNVLTVASLNVLNYNHVIFTPTTGGTVNLNNKQYNIINPAGAILAVTLNLPSSPLDGDVVYIKFTQNVTTVSFTGGTVQSGITSAAAGTTVLPLVYDSGTNKWY